MDVLRTVSSGLAVMEDAPDEELHFDAEVRLGAQADVALGREPECVVERDKLGRMENDELKDEGKDGGDSQGARPIEISQSRAIRRNVSHTG